MMLLLMKGAEEKLLNADWMLQLMPIVVVINSNEKLLMLMMVVTDADNK